MALFLTGLLLLYSPLVHLFDRPESWMGLPVLYVYLFGVWALLIGLAAWILSRAGS